MASTAGDLQTFLTIIFSSAPASLKDEFERLLDGSHFTKTLGEIEGVLDWTKRKIWEEKTMKSGTWLRRLVTCENSIFMIMNHPVVKVIRAILGAWNRLLNKKWKLPWGSSVS